jgi:dTDP-4-amino-4,6-dideoxygalactose transaminase
MLCDLGPGDEVIMPSYTFVSTANAVVRLGARPVFVDIRPDTLNLDESLIEGAITPRTRAIFPVHYAGVSCAMDRILEIARAHNLRVVEDAAQGVDAYYKGRALGSMGHLGTYSFHSTKNLACGEGGALCCNAPELIERAEIIRDKGTNRARFFRGQVDKYTWVDLGSSYIPNEIACAYLYAQLEKMDEIKERRQAIYEFYGERLQPLEAAGRLRLPRIPDGCEIHYDIPYILLNDGPTRDALMDYLKQRGISAVFHFIPLHSSPMGVQCGRCHGSLRVTDDLSARILRLPNYADITEEEQAYVADQVTSFLEGRASGRVATRGGPRGRALLARTLS